MTSDDRADVLAAASLPSASPRAESLPGSTVTAAGATALTARRAALWGMLLAKLLGTWGVQWDIQWHVMIGRDTFWIAPHLMTYAGVTLAVLLSWGTLAWETARGGAASPGAITVLGLRGTRGFQLAAWGIAVTVLAAPIDDLWHRLFGLDVTLWSPPHLMGICGSVINSLACLLIAQEVYSRDARARSVAVVVGGALLLGSLYWVVQPAHLTAYARGGIFFFTPPILSALVLPVALVTVARLSDLRWAPVLTLSLTVLVGVTGQQISDVGFAVLRPVSVIDDEIRKDPISPVALATEIARKQGVPPGRTGGLSHLWSLLAVAAMAAVDARRRPVGATAAYAAVLFVVSTWLLARSVAFGPAYPGLTLAALSLAITLVAGWLGAGLARWLADALSLDPPTTG